MSRFFADLSNNNSPPDFHAYRKAGHILVGLKATEGVGFIDSTYRYRVIEAHSHKIGVIHYHFARPDNHAQGQDEAEAFLRTVLPHFKRGDWLCLDIETAHPGGRVALWAYVHEFERVVNRSKHRLIGYSYAAFLSENGPIPLHSGRWWVADYSNSVKLPRWLHSWWAWQRTDGSHGPEPHKTQGIGTSDISLASRRAYLATRAGLIFRRKH